jgi:hypothetical protein
MGTWICREKCFWRDLLWTPGEGPNDKAEIESYQGRKWVFDGGGWVPEDIKVIDAKASMLIPAQFEPLDFGELVNPRDVLLARNRRKTERTWRFKHEVDADSPVDLDDVADPKPLNPTVLATLREDPDALVVAPPPRKRGGRPPLNAHK